MAFQNLRSFIGTVVGGESLIRSQDMPRKDLYREIQLNLGVNINITTLGSPVLRVHAPAAWLKRIELVADGKDTLKSIPARALFMKNLFLYGNYGLRTIPTLATGDNWMYQNIHIPLAMPHVGREIDTLIDSSLLSTLELRLTFGAKADGFSTAPTTYTMAAAQATVHLDSAINLSEGPLALNVYKEMTVEIPVTASSSNLQQLLPIGNLYRGFLIECEQNGEPVNNLVNYVTVQSGTTVYCRSGWSELQGRNKERLDIESLGGQTGTAANNPLLGYAYVDFCPEGRLVDCLDASRLSMLSIVLDATYASGTCYVRIYPDEVIVPVVVRAAAAR